MKRWLAPRLALLALAVSGAAAARADSLDTGALMIVDDEFEAALPLLLRAAESVSRELGYDA